MNISSIFSALPNRSRLDNNRMNGYSVHPKIVQSLPHDTFSFTGTAISEFVEKNVSDNMDRLSRIATVYLDALEAVTIKLKDDGYSFDRAACEKNAIKSPKSYTSKIVRSGKFKVPDTIRATIYCNDITNLEKLNDKLLPEMEKRGYVVADTEMPIKDLMKRGYIPTPEEAENILAEKTVPDLDIRLDDVSEQVTKLNPEFRYAIGKPQKSGYQDIQLRFVRKYDTKKNPVLHELIIILGPNYKQAKDEEYQKVYKYLRLFDEINLPENNEKNSPQSKKITGYIDLIRKMFTGKVSEKLYMNAINKDQYGINDEIPIVFSDNDKLLFNNYFMELTKLLTSAYTDMKKNCININEKCRLTKYFHTHLDILKQIQTGLSETIEHYNYKNELTSLLNTDN